MNFSKDDLTVLEKKFGIDFIKFLIQYSESANFFIAYAGAEKDRQWAILLCLGYAFLSKWAP